MLVDALNNCSTGELVLFLIVTVVLIWVGTTWLAPLMDEDDELKGGRG